MGLSSESGGSGCEPLRPEWVRTRVMSAGIKVYPGSSFKLARGSVGQLLQPPPQRAAGDAEFGGRGAARAAVALQQLQ